MSLIMSEDTVAAAALNIPGERSLLIVEDDKSFGVRLARAMEARGFEVTTAETVADGLLQVEKSAPAFAVVDMRLGDGNGLDVVSALKQRRPDARAIVLTGYGNIATAVNAVKIGAVDYLAKPADADDVINALLAIEGKKAEPPEPFAQAVVVRCHPRFQLAACFAQKIRTLVMRAVSEKRERWLLAAILYHAVGDGLILPLAPFGIAMIEMFSFPISRPKRWIFCRSTCHGVG